MTAVAQPSRRPIEHDARPKDDRGRRASPVTRTQTTRGPRAGRVEAGAVVSFGRDANRRGTANGEQLDRDDFDAPSHADETERSRRHRRQRKRNDICDVLNTYSISSGSSPRSADKTRSMASASANCSSAVFAGQKRQGLKVGFRVVARPPRRERRALDRDDVDAPRRTALRSGAYATDATKKRTIYIYGCT